MPPPYCYDYPRPAVTVDLALFAISDDGLRILLIRRKHPPFADQWALPGGFLEIDEPIEFGARRELREETGFDLTNPIHFLGVYGDPSRDPRGRTISLAHAGVIRSIPSGIAGSDDASEAAWRLARITDASLAFDHDRIVQDALRWLADGVRSGSVGLGLLPELFDEEDARRLYRSLFHSAAGSASWLKRMANAGLVEPAESGSRRLFRVCHDHSNS